MKITKKKTIRELILDLSLNLTDLRDELGDFKKEMRSEIYELKRNLGNLQDVVIGLNKYIEGELVVYLRSHDSQLGDHDKRITKLEN